MEKQGNRYGMRKRIKNNTRGKKNTENIKVQYCPARWIWPQLGSFYRLSLKSEAWRFLEKSPRPPYCERRAL